MTHPLDFRAHWRNLVSRPAFHEPVVDGMRAIAVLWVVILHSVYYHLGTLRAETGALFKGTFTQWIKRGDLGVDLFFVISGYLMGSILLKEWKRTGGIVWSRFYARRFLRLIPVYAVVMMLGIYLLRNTPRTAILMDIAPSGYAENLWANLLYVNNFLPRAVQYMPWCWSLAIEEQFYLVLPFGLLLFLGRGRGRVGLLLAGLVVSGVVQFMIMRAYDFRPPFTDTPDMPSWHLRYNVMYDKPYARFGGLLAGVTGAYVSFQYAGALQRFFSRRLRVTLLAGAALAVMFHIACQGQSTLQMLPAGGAQLWYALHRDVFSIAALFVILTATHAPQTMGGTLRSVLGWKGLYPVAQLSYSIYLVHEMICLWLFPKLAPELARILGGYGALVGDTLIALVLTFTLTTILYVTVERPCMELRSQTWIKNLGVAKQKPILEPA